MEQLSILRCQLVWCLVHVPTQACHHQRESLYFLKSAAAAAAAQVNDDCIVK